MEVNFSGEKLPEIFSRQGRECYLDPIRERLIFITPEETVRQKVISYILNKLKVPSNVVRIEEHLSHYGVESKRRADIIIDRYDSDQQTFFPLCIIECKAPQIMLDEKAQIQMMDYCDLLGCDYGMVTNGHDTLCYHYSEQEKRYEQIDSLPDYIHMVKGEFSSAPDNIIPKRLSHEEIPSHWDSYDFPDVGTDTPKEFMIPVTNLLECMLYPEHRLPIGKYKLFSVVKDLGVRILSYGNASGGMFQGPYRSFMLEYNGSNEILSIGFSAYQTYSSDKNKTVLCVAVDNEKTSHHALQLVIDDNVVLSGNKITFYHSGRIAVGNLGSGKIDELRMFVDSRYPQIIDGSRFNLGTLTDDILWNLDDPEVISFVENLLSYALIRDEYREYVKANKKK